MGRLAGLADADYNNIILAKIRVSSGKSARLPAASGCVVLRIEVEYNFLARKVRQRVGVAILVI